jgi:release factor glutamine methyltransferase
MTTNKIEEKTIGETLPAVTARLEESSETPGLDARSLLADLLGRPVSWVLAHPEFALDEVRAARLEGLVARLEQGEPLPYVLGHWDFFGLDFEVNPHVLIPRPETELLVVNAISWLHAHPNCRSAADVGTGSGCIGIALAVNVPDLRVTATDVSTEALEVARRNAICHCVDQRMDFVCTDLLPKGGAFDIVAANLPYIPTNTLQNLPVFGREPTLALDGGSDGMLFIRRLLREVPKRLLPGGLLLIEIEASEGLAALSYAYDVLSEGHLHLHKDLAGRDRLLEVQL